MTAHILVVEDDENIARMIEATLTIGGYTSAVCADGLSAVNEISSGQYDLVLLDIMLPKMDGFQVFENKGDNTTPVIFLTAMGDVPNKVKGLRMGAEDYIVKPFEAVELLARIEVALRRTQQENTALCYQNIVVETSKHEVTLNGEPVVLTPKEFDLLVFFIRNIDIALSESSCSPPYGAIALAASPVPLTPMCNSCARSSGCTTRWSPFPNSATGSKATRFLETLAEDIPAHLDPRYHRGQCLLTGAALQ